MAKMIRVEPSKLEEAAGLMEQQISDYQTIYNRLYSEVESMGESWKGADNTAFVEQINGFKGNFEAMVQVLNDYATFLRESAQIYRETQEAVIASAKTLASN